MLTNRSDRIRLSSLIVRTLWAWDLWAALAVSAVTLVLGLTVNDFKPTPGIFFTLGTSSAGFAVFVLTRRGSLRDRTLSDYYGEIVRKNDPESRALMMPYSVSGIVGVLSAGICILAAIFIQGVDTRLVQASITAIAALLFAWTFFGLFAIIAIESKHTRLTSRVKSVEEQVARRERESRSETPPPPDSAVP